MKTILRILCFLLPFSLTATTGRSEITKQQAIDFVMDSIVGDQADSMNVYMEAELQSGSYYILSPYDSISAPYSDYWLFFIDKQPDYGWGHACDYVFIDNTNGDHSIVSKRLPPLSYTIILEPVSVPIIFTYPSPNFSIPNPTLVYPPENHNLFAIMFTGGDYGNRLFWNAFSHMYCGLREHGFPKENIFVLSGDGEVGPDNPSLDLDNDGESEISTDPCSKEKVDWTFNKIADLMNEGDMKGDMLYVFVSTHGDFNPNLNSSVFYLYSNELLWDFEFTEMLRPINCAQMIFNIWSCSSGGFTDNLESLNNFEKNTILTCVDASSLVPRIPAFCNLTGMDTYNYLVCTALRGWHPDINPFNYAPWVAKAPVGSLSPEDFDQLFPGQEEVNYDLSENEGNGDGIQEINEVINYVKKYDDYFDELGSKVYDCGFHQGDEMQPAEDVLSIFGITGKVYHSQTVHGDFLIGGRLSVEPGVELTLDNTTTFHVFNSEIIIKPRSEFPGVDGAKLIIDGGKMTSAGENIMWKGIEVWGNPTLSQIPATNQGSLWIINNGEIRNAKIGVLVGKSDCEIGRNLEVCSTGGFVHGENARFINNNSACVFGLYQGINHSTFTKCDFLTDAALVDGSNPVHFVYLEGIQPVSFNGCTFMNSRNLIEAPYQNRGTAIFSVNSEIFINPVCLDMGNPCVNKRPTKFEKMTRGVYAMNSGAEHSVLINEAEFLDNHMGLYLSGFGGVSASEVLSSKFRGAPYSEFSYGMYLNECSGYHVENNEFYENIQITPISIGLIVNNSGPYSNEIYRNTFHNLKYATLSQNENRNGTAEGLCYICNKFVKSDGSQPNKYDFEISFEGTLGNNDGIASSQGSMTIPANNMFGLNPATGHYDFENLANHVDYYHPYNNTPLYRLIPDPNCIIPNIPTLSVTPIPTNVPFEEGTSCPSKLDGVPPDEEILLLGESESKKDSLEEVITTLVDGGSTELLNYEVVSSTPPEALQTRNELVSNSPYLSDTVMKTSVIKEDVLDNAMIRDVLVANPQSAKSDEIMGMLGNRAIPMPDYMMEQILAGADTVSPRETLEAEKAFWTAKSTESYLRLLKHFKGDSVTPANEDSLNWLFGVHNSLSSQYDKVCWLNAQGNYDQAGSLLAAIPAEFNLTASQLENHNTLTNYYELYEQIVTDTTGGMLSVDSAMATSLIDIVNSNSGLPASYARNILIANRLISYQEPIILQDTSLKSGNKKKFRGVKESFDGSMLSVYPNPASSYIIVKYNLDGFTENSKIILRDETGKTIWSMELVRKTNQEIIPISHLPSGIYIMTLEIENKRVESVKVAMVK